MLSFYIPEPSTAEVPHMDPALATHFSGTLEPAQDLLKRKDQWVCLHILKKERKNEMTPSML